MLSLLELDSIAEVASQMKVMKMKAGSHLPLTNKGMFVLLKGRLDIKTHWKIEDGQDELQKFYLDYISKQ